MDQSIRSNEDARKLGTFGGVFVPNVLTILGVIMFLRTGWVVGNAGLRFSLLILVIANTITLLTTLSLSAIATNTRVGVGGAYFLISRSLGPEIGGSVGVPLYFAQTISVGFYLLGFAESLQYLISDIDPRLAASLSLLVFFVIAWFGANFVTKAQYLILVVLLLSLVSFFSGHRPTADISSNMNAAYVKGQSFWTVFAIFFPAVTGIMSGVSMSGDLRRPSRSIPIGTISAVLVTFVIYAAQMIWLAISTDRHSLIENNLVMQELSRVPALIFAGLWAASLSSGLASLVAAPRTLQALASDAVVPHIFSRSVGRSTEPRIALILSGIIAQTCILVGDLNLIAPIISMFFLATYGTINLVAGLERLVWNPSFRPTFKVHWFPSLIGGLACVYVMLLINVWATLTAVLIIIVIYFYLTRARIRSTWGDMRSGLWFAITRFGLLRFDASRQHLRNWRPVLLVLSGNPKARPELIEFARWIEADRGLLFLAQIVIGDRDLLLARHHAIKGSLDNFIREAELPAIGTSVVGEDFEHGVAALLQVAGLGHFQPNTVLVGWSEDAFRQATFASAIRRILEMQKNLVVFEAAEPNAQLVNRFDVWWYAKDNGSLMLTMAHLLKSNSRWRDHVIRVLRIIPDEAGVERAEAGTREMIADFRIATEVRVIVSTEPVLDVIARVSERSAVCFAGVAVERNGSQENPLATYANLVTKLRGNVLLTKSWHDLGL